VLETALLLVSELVTSSVRHSGVPEGEDVVVRVDLGRDVCRLEVEDPGRDGVIARQAQVGVEPASSTLGVAERGRPRG
jgi:anti-sigma regulatory factor (Ser/Thr protein kinase)